MKLFKEFKEFISKGSVLDLAVGMIIGSAFTAIISAVVGNIFTPLLNLIPINETGLITVLREAVTDANGNVVVEALIIDWGAVITAIITFFVTAIILFAIVKSVNTARAASEKAIHKAEEKLHHKKGQEEVVEEVVAVEEVAPVEPAPSQTTTDELLAQIVELLKQNKVDASVNISDITSKED